MFLKNPQSLPPALRDPVTQIVGHHADQSAYDTLKKLGTDAVSTEEKLRYFDALASAADPSLMQQTVALAGSGKVPNGRVGMLLYKASLNSGNADELVKLVQPQEDNLNKRLPPDGASPTVLVAAAAGSSNADIARAVLADKSSKVSMGAHIWALRVADMIETAAELRQRAEPALAAWFKDKG
jgi:aminopeptidase N